MRDCVIYEDRGTGRSKGSGFILFEIPSSIDKVLSYGKQHKLDGRNLVPKRANALNEDKKQGGSHHGYPQEYAQGGETWSGSYGSSYSLEALEGLAATLDIGTKVVEEITANPVEAAKKQQPSSKTLVINKSAGRGN